MALLSAPRIKLTRSQIDILEKLTRAHTTPQQLATRARIILLAGEDVANREIARRLSIRNKTVRRWRGRWLARPGDPGVTERLADEPRPGAKATFTPEQICAIIALACEVPDGQDGGPPVTHWSRQALADEAVRRGIVREISQASVGRFLKRIRPQATPHPLLADAKTR